MKTDFPRVNAMGSRPMAEGSRDGDGGNNDRGSAGEVAPTGVVARGAFGGTRDMEGKVRMKGRKATGRSERRK